MISVVYYVLALTSLGLIAGGCADHVVDTFPKGGTPDKRVELSGRALACTPRWCGWSQQAASDDGAQHRTADVVQVGVVVHLMMAEIEDPVRRKYKSLEAWKLAPVARAIIGEKVIIEPGKPPIEYWTNKNLWAFFGPDGEINRIWAKPNKPGIRFMLAGVEDCTYKPGLLRLDGRELDSMFAPVVRTPWANQLFLSINRFFTVRQADKLHVMIWWSLSEDEFGLQTGPAGYSRSGARGGPAVWVNAYECLDRRTQNYYPACARLLAHEIGHALGLQHVDGPVDGPLTNLMHPAYLGEPLSKEQIEEAQREARRQFGVR